MKFFYYLLVLALAISLVTSKPAQKKARGDSKGDNDDGGAGDGGQGDGGEGDGGAGDGGAGDGGEGDDGAGDDGGDDGGEGDGGAGDGGEGDDGGDDGGEGDGGAGDGGDGDGGEGEGTTATEPSTTSTEATTTTTEASTTSTEATTTSTEATTTTTEATTTSTEATTTTTEPSTTSTEATTTTTEASTTSTEATTTSTEATTTTTEAITTTKKPEVDIPDNTVQDDKGNTCLAASLNLTLSVKYPNETSNNDLVTSAPFQVEFNKENSQGACAGATIEVDGKNISGPALVTVWSWPSKAKEVDVAQNTVIVKFADDGESTTLNEIEASISLENEDLFPNANKTVPMALKVNTDLSTEKGTSFKCGEQKEFEGESGKVSFNEVQFEVGSNSNATEFGKVGTTCGASGISVTISLLFVAILSAIKF